MRYGSKVLALVFLCTSPAVVGQPGAPDDPFRGDDRVVAKRTIRAHGNTLQEFLASLTEQTKIEFRADESVADEGIFVHVTRRPLLSTLRAVADIMQCSWKRTGSGREPQYTLIRTKVQRGLEKSESQMAIHKTAEGIHEELVLAKTFLALTKDERSQREKDAAARLNAAEGSERGHLDMELAVLRGVRTPDQGMALVARICGDLTTEEIEQLLQNERTEYTWPEAPDKRSIPSETVQHLRALVLPGRPQDPARPVLEETLRLAMGGVVVPWPTLQISLAVNRKYAGGSSTSSQSFQLPLTRHFDSEVSGRNNRFDWQRVRQLNTRTTLSVVPKSQQAAIPKGEVWNPMQARYLDALEDSQPIDLVSDVFPTRSLNASYLTISEKPLGEAIDIICDQTHQRWDYHEGLVTLRSFARSLTRDSEPPIRLLKRWTAMTTAEISNLDTLSEIANLPIPSCFSACYILADCGAMPPGWFGLPMARSHLVFWHALTPQQRNKAFTPGGIPYSELSEDQKEVFVLASTDKFAAMNQHSSNQNKKWSAEALANAYYRVEYQDVEKWVYRAPSGSVAFNGSRDEAVMAFVKKYPDFKPNMLEQHREKTVQFRYCATGLPDVIGFLHL